MHSDLLIVGLPLLIIVAGQFFNWTALKDLRLDMRSETGSIRTDLSKIEARLDRMQADLAQFYRTLGEHEKAIEVLEKKP